MNFEKKPEGAHGKKCGSVIDHVQAVDCLHPNLKNRVRAVGNLSMQTVRVGCVQPLAVVVWQYPAVVVCLLRFLVTVCVLPSSSLGYAPTNRSRPNRLYRLMLVGEGEFH